MIENTIHGSTGYIASNGGICLGEHHSFIFAGSGKIPEGYLCACGQKKLHYKICPTCGHEITETVDSNY